MKTLQVVLVGVLTLSLTDIGASQCDVVRLAAAVHETLSPFMTEIRESLAAVTTEMRETVAAVKENLTIIEGEVFSLSRDFEDHKNKTTTELAAIDSKLNSLDSKQDGLSMTVMTVHSEQEHNVLTNVTKELKKTADYILGHVPTFKCGGTGGWRRVVYLNMTDPNTYCPSGWQLTSHSKRTCGRVSAGYGLSCDSVFFPVSGGDYSSVCGSMRAYQYGQIDGFELYHDGRATTIEEPYVCGVSLTHGSPRQHIWTFAAGSSEVRPTWEDACPCDASISITIPPFVGEDYFCESGDLSGSPVGNFYLDDPLWDGEGCSSNSSCCSFNKPPYFTQQLPSPTSDPIEARLCRLGLDDSPVEFMELYVK